MNSIAVILFALLALAATAALIKCLLWKLRVSSEGKLLIAATVAVTLLFEGLFIASSFIPKTIDKVLTRGIAELETSLEETSPGYIHRELSTEEIKSVISDSRRIKASIENDAKAGFIVRAAGLDTYIRYLDRFGEGINANLQEFEASGTPFTLHNIFIATQDKIKGPAATAAKTVQIVLLVLFGLLVVAIGAFAASSRKELANTGNSSVTFGDEAA